MFEIVCIKKSGSIKSLELSSLISLPINLEALLNADKKTLKMFRGYSCECDFNLDDYTVTILGKTGGKDGSENKKELPPPIDKEIYFGNVYAIAHHNDSFRDLTIQDFEEFYNSAFGGFEDLGEEDSWSEEEEENTEDREFINDDTESPNKDSIDVEEEEYEFSEEETTEETTDETDDEIINDLEGSGQIEDPNDKKDYDQGFSEGRKYCYLIQQFLRELDTSLPKRRKQFYALCPQEFGEIIYTNHKNNKDAVVVWLENKIKADTLGGVKVIYIKFLKRYKADFIP